MCVHARARACVRACAFVNVSVWALVIRVICVILVICAHTVCQCSVIQVFLFRFL